MTQSVTVANPLYDTEKIEQILKWMLAGESEFTIAESMAKHWPHADPGPLITAAVDQLVKSATENDETVVTGWCFQATRFVYQKQIEIGDYTGALRAIKQMAEFARKYGGQDVRETIEAGSGEDGQAQEGNGTTD